MVVVVPHSWAITGRALKSASRLSLFVLLSQSVAPSGASHHLPRSANATRGRKVIKRMREDFAHDGGEGDAGEIVRFNPDSVEAVAALQVCAPDFDLELEMGEAVLDESCTA